MKNRWLALVFAGVLAATPALSAVSLTPSLSGDLNGDGALNSADMRALLLARQNGRGHSDADLNQNGTVNAMDEALLWEKIVARLRGTQNPTATDTATVTATGTATVTAADEATATATKKTVRNLAAPSKTATASDKTSTAKPTVTTAKKPTTAKKTTAKTTKKTTAKTTKKTTAKTTKKTTVAVGNAHAQAVPTKKAVLSPGYTPTLKASSVKESVFMKKIKVVNSATGKVYTADTKANLQLAVTADVKYELGSARYGASSTEAWKAHAVASYSRMCDIAASGSTFTISMHEDVNLNNATDKRIYDAVGQVLGIRLMTGASYQNTCNVFYHASAAGTTSSCNKVFTEDLPYARSVFSPETDALVKQYGGLYTDTYTASFDSILKDVSDYLEETIYYDKKAGLYPLYATEWDGAYVARTNLYYKSGGQKVYVLGRHIRSALGLRSASFAVTASSGGKLTLTVHGHGHGLGLSQLGAVIYANEYGWTYSQILAHYYSITANSAHQLCKPNW